MEDEVPENAHEIIVTWLIWVLRQWGTARGVIVLGSGAKFAIGSRSAVACPMSASS